MPIKAIIFDMDGLLVNSEPLSQQAWNDYLRPFHCQLIDAQIEQLIGLRSEVSAQFVKDTFDLPQSVETIVREKAAVYANIRANGVPAMPGLHELMAELARRSLPWGVATSSPRHHALEILTQHNLLAQCQAITGGDEVTHGKPHPEIYLLAAQRIGVPPQDCLAFEDSRPGSQAAVAAGMRTVAVPNVQTRSRNFDHVHQVLPSLTAVLLHLDQLLH